jgi:hypothetical protein
LSNQNPINTPLARVPQLKEIGDIMHLDNMEMDLFVLIAEIPE